MTDFKTVLNRCRSLTIEYLGSTLGEYTAPDGRKYPAISVITDVPSNYVANKIEVFIGTDSSFSADKLTFRVTEVKGSVVIYLINHTTNTIVNHTLDFSKFLRLRGIYVKQIIHTPKSNLGTVEQLKFFLEFATIV